MQKPPPAAARWLPCWAREDGLHSLTLSFQDARTEREYARSSKGALTASMFWMGCGTLLLCGGRLGAWILSASEQDLAYPEQHDDMLAGWGSGCVYAVLQIVLSKTGFLLARATPRMLECWSATFMLLLMTGALLGPPHTFARVRGYDLPGCVPDIGVFANLVAAVLTSLTLLNMRWSSTIVIQVYALACYAVHVVLHRENECSDVEHAPTRVMIFVQLACIILLASKGKREMEVQTRQLFIHVIHEKTHRVESEFQLDQLQRQREPPRQHRAASIPESVPTTTSTGVVFELGNDTNNITKQLSAIAELGGKEHWLIDTSEVVWNPHEILGAGGFGIVASGVYLGLKVAVKVPKHPVTTGRSKSALVELCNELRIMRRLCHPNIVTLFGACVDVEFSDIALVIERVNGCSLLDCIQSSPRSVERARILQEVASALHYLHAQMPRVVHGDLKDTNIFVEQSSGEPQEGDPLWGPAKLLDFGLARQVTKRARPLGGSVRWMAPEALSGGLPQTPADVFSMGRVTFFAVTGVRPGEGRQYADVLRKLHLGEALQLQWPRQNSFADKYQDIVHRCSLRDPRQRPQMEEVRNICTQFWRECADLTQHPEAARPDFHSELQALRDAASHRQKSASARRRAAGQELKPAAKQQEAVNNAELAEEEAVTVTRTVTCSSRLVHPDMEETPMETQMQAVAPALCRCNFRIEREACCPFHASVRNLARVVETLETKCCTRLEPIGGQCPSCHILLPGCSLTGDEVDGERYCDCCGEVIQAGAQ